MKLSPGRYKGSSAEAKRPSHVKDVNIYGLWPILIIGSIYEKYFFILRAFDENGNPLESPCFVK
jgi:hypothetical protein